MPLGREAHEPLESHLVENCPIVNVRGFWSVRTSEQVASNSEPLKSLPRVVSKYLVLTIGVIKQNVGIWYMPKGMQHEIPHPTGDESRVMSQLECRRIEGNFIPSRPLPNVNRTLFHGMRVHIQQQLATAEPWDSPMVD